MSSLVYIAFQDNDNARYLVEAIIQDNPTPSSSTTRR